MTIKIQYIMPNYNLQQQAVILKGIAQQTLSMNIPSFNEVDKLFKQFEQTLYPVSIVKDLIEKEQQLSQSFSYKDVKSIIIALLFDTDSKQTIKGRNFGERADTIIDAFLSIKDTNSSTIDLVQRFR